MVGLQNEDRLCDKEEETPPEQQVKRLPTYDPTMVVDEERGSSVNVTNSRVLVF